MTSVSWRKEGRIAHIELIHRDEFGWKQAPYERGLGAHDWNRNRSVNKSK